MACDSKKRSVLWGKRNLWHVLETERTSIILEIRHGRKKIKLAASGQIIYFFMTTKNLSSREISTVIKS